jgi:hypothetical protein
MVARQEVYEADVTPTAPQPGGRGSTLQSRMSMVARGVLIAALAFTTIYIAYAAVSIFVTDTWTSSVPRRIAEVAMVLGTLVCAEMLVLGLNASFLRDRLVPRECMQVAYAVLGATAAAAFGLALFGDLRFAAALASLVLPGAAAYAILSMFSPAYVARQEERARERARRRAAARATRSGRSGTARPAAKPSGDRTQAGVKSRQRKGGRKRR